MSLAKAIGASGAGGDHRLWVNALLIEVDNDRNRALVSVDGSDPVWLPFNPGIYEGVTVVRVLRDPYRGGAGQLVLGPGYAQEPEEVPPAPPPPPPPDAEPPPDAPARPVTVTVAIRPTWSGTFRHIRSAWDRWNVSRYGGRSTLYQGNAFGSGKLTGLAVYGTQVRDLGASRITRITVSTPVATGAGSVVLQGSPHGTAPGGAPATSGETRSGGGSVTLSAAMCEAFRTGSTRGLATVGSDYRGTYGTAKANGMTLTVTYERPA